MQAQGKLKNYILCRVCQEQLLGMVSGQAWAMSDHCFRILPLRRAQPSRPSSLVHHYLARIITNTADLGELIYPNQPPVQSSSFPVVCHYCQTAQQHYVLSPGCLMPCMRDMPGRTGTSKPYMFTLGPWCSLCLTWRSSVSHRDLCRISWAHSCSIHKYMNPMQEMLGAGEEQLDLHHALHFMCPPIQHAQDSRCRRWSACCCRRYSRDKASSWSAMPRGAQLLWSPVIS